MPNDYFQFKQFLINQDKCAMKVGTDAVLLGAWANVDRASSILEIGSGSGVISLMLAQRSQAQIEAVEIDESAYLQSVENINLSKWNDRINVKHVDFQAFEVETKNRYDLIVSNPPYFVNSLKTKSQILNMARHNDKLSFNDLISGASNLLNESGRFALILPYTEGCLFIAEAVKKSLFCVKKTIVKSKPNTQTIRLLLEFSKTPSFCEENYLVIETDLGKHSEKYKKLTEDFYL